MFQLSPWILLLSEPVVLLYDGREWFTDPATIKERLHRSGGSCRLKVIVHETATEWADCTLPRQRSFWGRYVFPQEVPGILWHKAVGRFASTEGIGWMRLKRDTLLESTPANGRRPPSPTASDAYVLGHMTPSPWLRGWLDICAQRVGRVVQIVPIGLVCHRFLRSSRDLPRRDLTLVLLPLPRLGLTILLALLDGEFVLTRSWSSQRQPMSHEGSKEIFSETIRYFDQFPRTRGLPSHTVILDPAGNLYSFEGDQAGGMMSPGADVSTQADISRGAMDLTKKLVLFARDLPRKALPFSFHFSPILILGRLQRLWQALLLLGGVTTLWVAFLTVPLLREGMTVQSAINAARPKAQEMRDRLGKLPPLSAEKAAFMAYADAMEQKNRELQGWEQRVDPLSMIPTLSLALGSRWRLNSLDWRAHGSAFQQGDVSSDVRSDQGPGMYVQPRGGHTLRIVVRYVGQQSEASLEIEKEFRDLHANLQRVFPSAEVGVVLSPYEGKSGQPTSMTEIHQASPDWPLTGAFDIVHPDSKSNVPGQTL